ncbi:hypothetical protein SACE_1747 [Saccharopolyspora erythraea NRRL 2338]|uniref:Uncharacterized protein n=1 Tax=Saccharopolyspora erythraea (strain ATCC 11635 / DSM 40517 / JCM 4748 / NBRC 13426 / NCIMB 8594 / NRRL 2338) TaxID=405948 RepID=A4FAJ0_SACEN|nr:hypothetical protein SACE_1747 [Saccharopolyspora erythraea NRRL 2338]
MGVDHRSDAARGSSGGGPAETGATSIVSPTA